MQIKLDKLEPQMEELLQAKRVKFGSYKAGLVAILEEYFHLQHKIEELEQEAKIDKTAFRNIALKPANYYPASNMNQQTNVMLAPPPIPPKPLKEYLPQQTDNLKQDYIQEIKQVFTGEIRKPSEIAQATKPQFHDHAIKTLDDLFIVPEIETISTAKSFLPTERKECE